MRVRVLKRVFLIAGIVLLVFAAIVAGIVIKQVYFPYYWNYELNCTEAIYTVNRYETDDIITPETVIQVFKEKPEVANNEFIYYFDIGDEYEKFYFVFKNLDSNIKELHESAVKCKMIFFTVYFKDGSPRSGFTLYSKDWNKGCGIVGTDITFKAV